MNKHTIERSTYGLFDMLGDVGGLNDLLKSFGAFVVGILQFQVFENYLVSQLYKEQKNID